MKIDPNKDGIDHINVYSKGKTPLGKYLSNFQRCDLFIEKDGWFQSVEGYWYWLLSNKDEESNVLRTLSGWEAKEAGRALKIVDWPDAKLVNVDDFQEAIIAAIYFKVTASPLWTEELINSKLPFVHYYVYGSKVVKPKDCKWIMEGLEVIREQLQNETY